MTSIYLFGAHSATGNLEEVLSTIAEVMSASLKQQLDGFVRFKQDVDVASCGKNQVLGGEATREEEELTFGGITRVFAFLSWPLNPHGSIGAESVLQPSLSDVPRDTPEKDFARVRRILVDLVRQLSAPGASRLTNGCKKQRGWSQQRGRSHKDIR